MLETYFSKVAEGVNFKIVKIKKVEKIKGQKGTASSNFVTNSRFAVRFEIISLTNSRSFTREMFHDFPKFIFFHFLLFLL